MSMTSNEYGNFVWGIASEDTRKNKESQWGTVGLGISGEAGEVSDLVKKFLFQGHKIDETLMKKELGDVLWYIALAARIMGTTIDELCKMNYDKLMQRYPTGEFKAAESLERKVGDN